MEAQSLHHDHRAKHIICFHQVCATETHGHVPLIRLFDQLTQGMHLIQGLIFLSVAENVMHDACVQVLPKGIAETSHVDFIEHLENEDGAKLRDTLQG